MSPPSRILHVSNLEDSTEEMDIANKFGDVGDFEAFKWISGGKGKQCNIKVSSVGVAVEIIAK